MFTWYPLKPFPKWEHTKVSQLVGFVYLLLNFFSKKVTLWRRVYIFLWNLEIPHFMDGGKIVSLIKINLFWSCTREHCSR